MDHDQKILMDAINEVQKQWDEEQKNKTKQKNKSIRIRIMVRCAPYEQFRVYGFYMNYSKEQIFAVLSSFPDTWASSVNSEI